MKRIPNWVYLAIAIVLFGGTTLFLENKPVEYEATESPVINEKVIMEDMLEERIKSSQKQEMGRLEQESQAAYDAKMQQGLKEIKLEVIKAYQVELDELEESLEKEVGAY